MQASCSQRQVFPFFSHSTLYIFFSFSSFSLFYFLYFSCLLFLIYSYFPYYLPTLHIFLYSFHPLAPSPLPPLFTSSTLPFSHAAAAYCSLLWLASNSIIETRDIESLAEEGPRLTRNMTDYLQRVYAVKLTLATPAIW